VHGNQLFAHILGTKKCAMKVGNRLS